MDNDFVDLISNMNTPLMGIIFFLTINIAFGLICLGLYKMSDE